jgi:hypothetical protein
MRIFSLIIHKLFSDEVYLLFLIILKLNQLILIFLIINIIYIILKVILLFFNYTFIVDLNLITAYMPITFELKLI